MLELPLDQRKEPQIGNQLKMSTSEAGRGPEAGSVQHRVQLSSERCSCPGSSSHGTSSSLDRNADQVFQLVIMEHFGSSLLVSPSKHFHSGPIIFFFFSFVWTDLKVGTLSPPLPDTIWILNNSK